MQKKLKSMGLYTIAWVLIPIGGVGLVLPIIPGVVLLLVGLYVLSIASPRIRESLVKYRLNHSWVEKYVGPLEIRARKFFRLPKSNGL